MNKHFEPGASEDGILRPRFEGRHSADEAAPAVPKVEETAGTDTESVAAGDKAPKGESPAAEAAAAGKTEPDSAAAEPDPDADTQGTDAAESPDCESAAVGPASDAAAAKSSPVSVASRKHPRVRPSFLNWITGWRGKETAQKGERSEDEDSQRIRIRHRPPRYSTAMDRPLDDRQRTPARRPLKRTPVPLRKMRRRLYLLAFFLPLLGLFAAYSTVGFFPVGDKTPLAIDMYHQYAPFLSELKRKLLSGDGLFYAWNSGLGTNFYALLAYYAASPFNLLLLFFPMNYLTEGIYVLTLLKTGFMGLTMAIFLDRGLSRRGLLSLHRPPVEEGEASRAETRFSSPPASPAPRYAKQDTATDLAILGLASAYALSAYTFSYAWCVMWLDGLILLPLVMLGLLHLMRSGRFSFYALTLGLTIIVNYYIAVFVCLFAVFYFFYQLLVDKPVRRQLTAGRPGMQLLKQFVRFGFASLLGAGISAILSLPTFLSLLHTSASGDTWPAAHSFFFELFDYPARHFLGTVPNIRSGLPNIYSGVLSILLIPLYLRAERISLREKACSVTALILLFLAFNSNFFNFFWHGLHYPNQLPHRFAFVYVFFLLTLAYRGLTHTDFKGSAGLVLKTASALAFYLFLVQKLEVEELSEATIYINLLFLAIYVLIFFLAKVHRHRLRYAASFLLVVFLCELCMNGISMANQVNKNEYYTRRSDFIRDFDEIEELIEEVKAREPAEAFYRMELIPQKTTNDPSLYGYPGFTLFSSTSPKATAALMRSLGYHGNNINSYKYVDSTPFMDALLGLKYFIQKNDVSPDPRHILLRELTTEDRTARLYENPDAVGLGITAHPSLEGWQAEGVSAFENQRKLALSLTGIDGLYEPLPLEELASSNAAAQESSPEEGYKYRSNNTKAAGNYSLNYTAPEAKRVFFHVDTSRKSTIRYEVRRGEELVREASRLINKPEVFDPGPLAAGDTLTIAADYKANEGSEWTIRFVEQPEEVYTRIIEALQQRSVDWTYQSATSLTARLKQAKDAVLFLSIPYDAGWRLYIDDAPADEGLLIKVGDGLLGYRLPEGAAELRLEFKPEGYTIGMGLTLVSLAFWIVLTVLVRGGGLQRGPAAVAAPGDADADGKDGPGGSETPPDEAAEPRIDNPLERIRKLSAAVPPPEDPQ